MEVKKQQQQQLVSLESLVTQNAVSNFYMGILEESTF